jgi:hypothetical protein
MTKKRRRNQLQPDPSSAGQSGGDQGLPRSAGADPESVEELVEEGNAFEAALFSVSRTPKIPASPK